MRGDYRVAESVEPGARVEVVPAGFHLERRGPVRVAHDDEAERGISGQEILGPGTLPCGGRVHRRADEAVLTEPGGEPVHEREPHIGGERAIHGRRGPGGHQVVEQAGAAASVGHAVAVQGDPPASADDELEPLPVPSEARFLLPELGAPAVVVAAHHEHGHPPGERGERGGDPERTARQRGRIGEPELEKVAVDEQRVAQRGDGVEELEQRGFDRRRGVAEVGVGDDDEGLSQHGRKHAEVEMRGQPEAGPVSETLVRVNYSETDQMGVAYHARYLVWLDVARCEHLRHTGLSYRDLEASGLRLVVGEAAIRYRRPARYDDLLRVRCWVRDVASRRVVFGYAVENAETGLLLATATVSLLPLDASMALCRLPDAVAKRLRVAPDPVRL